MPKGQPVTWTRESLERVRDASGASQVGELCNELPITPSTVYSVKSRIKHGAPRVTAHPGTA